MSTIRNPFTYADPLPETKSHLSSPQWAADLFNDPSLKAITSESRVIKSASTADTLCAVTLATPETIIACQKFHKAPSAPGKFSEVIQVVKLGSGLNGHIDTCHGGFLGVLLDEIIGTAAESERPVDNTTMTAYLKVDYKRPVKTPSTILCRAWLEKIEGRKIYGRGTIEDGKGTVLTTGEALFVIAERTQLKASL